MITDPSKVATIVSESFAQPKTISILINTRNRVDMLLRTIDSLYHTASNPDDIEVMVYVDEDDSETIDKLKHLENENVKTVIGPRVGYGRAHEMYMESAKQASGEYLAVWTDDFIVNSHGWDEYITPHRGKIRVIWTKRELIPMIHRSIPLVWERFGICYSVDVHYKIVALELGAYVRQDEIEVVHLEHEMRWTTKHSITEKDYEWPKDKGLIYEMTDVLKPFVEPVGKMNPITTQDCNTYGHPINDPQRNKVYWWPIDKYVDRGYEWIKDSQSWFFPHQDVLEHRAYVKGAPPPMRTPVVYPGGMPPSIG